METNFYVYIVQVNAALLLFYLAYRFFLHGDTFFTLRRVSFVSVLFLSFVYPLIDIPAWALAEAKGEAVHFVSFLQEKVTLQVGMLTETLFTAKDLLFLLYGVGVMVLGIRLAIQLGGLFRIVRRGRLTKYNGFSLIAPTEEVAPFSFFGWIVIDREKYSERELGEILLHEITHVRQQHSWDVMLSECICIVLWFNPVVWLFREAIRQNLEFLADRAVLEQGCDRKKYQYHLLSQMCQLPALSFVNHFGLSSLKFRIRMMNRKKSQGVSRIKYAVLLSVTGLLFSVGNLQSESIAGVMGSDFLKRDGEPKEAASQFPLVSVPVVPMEKSDFLKGKELIIVNGKKMPEGYDLNRLSPEEIESITVLKGEVAEKLYGKPAASGVLLIQTYKK